MQKIRNVSPSERFVEPAGGERDIVVTTSVRCMCVRCPLSMRACVRPDLSELSLVHLCMDFKIIWHSCFT